jgi:hypothetical protein
MCLAAVRKPQRPVAKVGSLTIGGSSTSGSRARTVGWLSRLLSWGGQMK